MSMVLRMKEKTNSKGLSKLVTGSVVKFSNSVLAGGGWGWGVEQISHSTQVHPSCQGP